MKAIDPKKALPILVAIITFVVLTLGYFSPVLEGKRLIQSDIRQYAGMAQEMQEFRAANDGQEPLWTESMFSGMPGYQIGVVWKGNALKFVDNLFHGFLPAPASFVFLYLIGMFVLLMCLRVDPWLALVGAIAYAFSSYFLVIIEAGHNSKANAVGYMPMVLGGLYVLLRGRKWLGAGLFTLFLSLEVYMNHVQVAYYMGMLLVLFGLAETWRAIQEKRMGDFAGRVGLAVVGVAFAVVCNLGLLWSTYEYGKFSTRGPTELTITADGTSNKENKTSGLNRDYVTHWSYGKQESLSLLVPNIKGGASGSMIQSREDLDNIPDPAFRNEVLKKYQAGGYVNNYWGDQEFTSGPVYVGAIVILLLLLALSQAEGKAKWWVLGALPLIPVLLAIGSPVLAGVLLIAYLLSGLFLWKDTLSYALFSALLLTLFLSWGSNYMPLTDFFLDHVPGYDKFRSVTIIMVIVELCAPVLAVLYLDRLMRSEKWDRAAEKRFLVPAGVLLLVLVVIAVMPGNLFDLFGAQEKDQLAAQVDAAGKGASAVQDYIDGLKAYRIGVLSADAWRSFGFVLVGAGLVIGFGRRIIGRPVLIAGIGVLMIIDLWGVDKRYVNNDQEKGRYLHWEDEASSRMPYKPQPADMSILQSEQNANTEADYDDAIARLKAEKAKGSGVNKMVTKDEELLTRFGSLRRTTNYRVLTLRGWYQDTRVSYFHKSIGGYHGAKLKRYQELIEFHLTPEISDLIGKLQTARSQGAVDSAFANAPVLNMLNTRYLIVADDKPPLRNPKALGSAWFVDQVKEVRNADEEITELGKIDPAHTALVDARYFADVANAAHVDSTARVTLKEYRTNEMNYTVGSLTGGVVVFSEIWYGPDWVAEIDGEPAPYVRADYTLRAIKVPPGEHTVRFHVVSKPYTVGGRIAAISSWVLVLLVLALFGLEWKRSREDASGTAA